MEIKTINAKNLEENLTLQNVVDPENDLKNFFFVFAGEKLDPKDKNVTVEMIVETVAREFPEFLLAVAEENWVRGYQQALNDVDTGLKIEKENKDERKKTCKLCEKP